MAKQKADFKDILTAYSANNSTEFVKMDVDCLNDLWGGGMNPGSMYSLWAEPGGGKTTISNQCMKSFLKKGLKVVFIDVEKALNSNQKETFGLTKYEEEGLFIHLTIDNYEELENIVNAVVKMDVALVVLDSETEITPVVSAEATVSDYQIGLKAKQASYILTKMKSLFYKAKITSIIIFHARANIQINAGTQTATKQAGGFAASHIPDVITKIQVHGKFRENPSDKESNFIGVEITLMTEKNKFTSPFIPYRKKLVYGKGISKRIDLVDTAIERGIIVTGGGGYFTLPDGSKVRGMKALYDLPNEDLKKLQTALD